MMLDRRKNMACLLDLLDPFLFEDMRNQNLLDLDTNNPLSIFLDALEIN